VNMNVVYIYYRYLDYKEAPQRQGKGWWRLMSDVTQGRAGDGLATGAAAV